MCGIIAYSGFRDSKEVLLNGLEKIQYRGYDSMGLLVAGFKGFKRVRSVGGIQCLKKKLKEKANHKLSGFYGMAHSRWATHGAPLTKNAHPHKAGPFYIVHNGIIENAESLKAELSQYSPKSSSPSFKRPVLLSDTDSEVVAYHLLSSYQKHCGELEDQKSLSDTLKEAVFDTLSKLKGEYAILLMSEKHPGEIWAFKKGPSLLLGMGKNEVFICSDIQGILPDTNKVIFMQDGEVAHIKNASIENLFNSPSKPKAKGPPKKSHIYLQLYSFNQKKIKRPFVVLDPKTEQADRGHWPCYMLKEIHEQPGCILKLVQSYTHQGLLRFPNQKILSSSQTPFLDSVVQSHRLSIVACGSSYYSALFGKYVIEKLAQVSVQVDMASEFRYRAPSLPRHHPLLLISQSGETADTLSVLKMAKKQGQPVFSLCNVVHSSLDRGAEQKLYMLAGPEKAVASTKAFTSTLTILFLLALSLAKQKALLSKKEEHQWVKSLCALPSYAKALLSMEKEYKTATQRLISLKKIIYVGRDIYYPLAQEGALKMKELSYRHAEAYPAGELKHGPLALVDENMAIVGIAPKSTIWTKTKANLEEVRCRGAQLIIIGTKADLKMKDMATVFLPLPPVNECLSAILCALPLQMMAYHTALVLGHNVDQPRNLAKSVTVE